MTKDILNNFLTPDGKVSVWPAKASKKLVILDYLITKFQKDKIYTEKQVNDILRAWHTFDGWAVLRRALIDGGLMTRDKNGYEYKVKSPPNR